MAEELLRLEDLRKFYTSSQTVVMGLNDVSLKFQRGEFVAVTGESGSGKSTFAHVVGGIIPYEGGEMYVEGRPTSHYDGADWERYRRDRISFISQSYGILPGCSVQENVVSALRLSGMDKATAVVQAEEILREVELWELRTRRAGKLSSGQKQRLSIARALAKPAPILIADEPTGNLDPENSAKIISLLARAAKERLVILITHEFSEAAEYVTRHITLRDGQVVQDAVLRPAPPQAEEERQSVRRRGVLSPYVATLQLAGRPVWAVLVLLFFALTAFSVFAFLGTFVISLDDTDTRLYDSAAFLNGDRRRIVVVREDLHPFTGEDLSGVLALDHVEAVEEWGYVADVNYAWQEGVDYRYKYSIQSAGNVHDRTRELYASVSVLDGAPFLRTIPHLSGGQEFLAAGRLPENIYEVVAAGNDSLLGSTFPVFIQDRKNWNISAKIDLQVTVVGVTDYGSGLYFHEDLGRSWNDCFVLREREGLFLYSADLAEDQIRPSEEFYRLCMKYEKYALFFPGGRAFAGDGGEELELRLICEENGNEVEGLSPTHNAYLNSYWQVSPAAYERLVLQAGSDQISVTISDYAYMDRVLEELRGLGYMAVSPFREGSTTVSPTLAKERLRTLAVCAAALVGVIVLQIMVLWALFGVQTENYRLLSNIGLTCPVAKRSLLWQILLFTLLGQAVGLAGLLGCAAAGVERIVRVMRYLPPAYAVLFLAVHLAASLLAAAWIAGSMARRVFPPELREIDLDMDEEAAV